MVSQVVKHELDATFAALADPTRRAIVARLARGETVVGDLAKRFPISLPAVSKHLRVLEDAGLIERIHSGRVHTCRLRPTPLRAAVGWIDARRAQWERRLDALATYLEEETDA
jgi:DNA-binding transcriptional ArsR family regulator